jgi:RAT1-interacting protein
LSTLQTFRTIEIPRLVRGKGNKECWEPGVCLRWGERFLGFLRGVVGGEAGSGAAAAPSSSSELSNSTQIETGTSDKENKNDKEKEPTVWRVTFMPREGINVRVLDEDEVDDVRGGEDRVGFLPRWFWKEFTLL